MGNARNVATANYFFLCEISDSHGREYEDEKSLLGYSAFITLMMEAVRTSETSVYSNETTALYPRRLPSSYFFLSLRPPHSIPRLYHTHNSVLRRQLYKK
jgi:hypothetical protein